MRFNEKLDLMPNEIRILPMTSDKELEYMFHDKTPTQIQQKFFKDELKKHGEYQIRTNKFSEPNNIFVLFQFKKQIIAASMLSHFEKYETKIDDYVGKYIFYKDSILIFDPISEKDFGKNIEPKKFTQATHIVNIVHWNGILNLIKNNNGMKL